MNAAPHHTATPFQLTNYAAVRLQQGGMPVWFVDFLVQHGKTSDDGHGAERMFVEKEHASALAGGVVAHAVRAGGTLLRRVRGRVGGQRGHHTCASHTASPSSLRQPRLPVHFLHSPIPGNWRVHAEEERVMRLWKSPPVKIKWSFVHGKELTA